MLAIYASMLSRCMGVGDLHYQGLRPYFGGPPKTCKGPSPNWKIFFELFYELIMIDAYKGMVHLQQIALMCCLYVLLWPWKGPKWPSTGVFAYFQNLQQRCNIMQNFLYQSIAGSKGFHMVPLLSGLRLYVKRYVQCSVYIYPKI